MYLVGITGGIASGKSTVSRHLERRGAVRIDADEIAREVVAVGTPALAALTERFGHGILDGSGALDRQALAAIVFADEAALAALNAIVHPAVQRRVAELLALVAAERPDAIVVYDVPLLVEAGVTLPFDLVVSVEAPVAARIERLRHLRGFSRADAERRIARQASASERALRADIVLDASGTLAATLAAADRVWEIIAKQIADSNTCSIAAGAID